MLRIEKTVTPSQDQWRVVIEGMRNPLNSWGRMDSIPPTDAQAFAIGDNDLSLMRKLASNGSTHAKYRRMLPVWVTLTAPLYWWKEFDTYKVGTVANSCSTMHKIHDKPFEIEDFSTEQLTDENLYRMRTWLFYLNDARDEFLLTHDKEAWWQMIQMLPSSYNQKRTVMLNYEVLSAMYHDRKDHKLNEWRALCSWMEDLPYSEIITGV